MREGCPFCYINGSDFPHFNRYGVEKLDQFIGYESPHFYLKPDILPNVKTGLHFLLVPKVHKYNFVNLGYSREVGGIMREMESKFGQALVLEHGGIEDGSNNQSIYHAHAHLVYGIKGNILNYMEDMLNGGLAPDYKSYPYKRIETPSPVISDNIRFENKPYFYVQKDRGGIIVYGDTASQITQRALHLYNDRCIMDWKKIETSPELQRQSVIRILRLINASRKKS